MIGCAICYHLHNLKREKHPERNNTVSKVAGLARISIHIFMFCVANSPNEMFRKMHNKRFPLFSLNLILQFLHTIERSAKLPRNNSDSQSDIRTGDYYFSACRFFRLFQTETIVNNKCAKQKQMNKTESSCLQIFKTESNTSSNPLAKTMHSLYKHNLYKYIEAEKPSKFMRILSMSPVSRPLIIELDRIGLVLYEVCKFKYFCKIKITH